MEEGRAARRQDTSTLDIFTEKDLMDHRVIDIQYCQTEAMIADFFTKPLQGKLFKKLKDVIMGKVSIQEFTDSSIATKERVGECVAAADGDQQVTVKTDKERKYAMYADCVRCSSEGTKDTLKIKDDINRREKNMEIKNEAQI